jgi:hypothetical protein
VRLDEQPYVGNAAARAVHGHSAGGDLVLLGDVASDDLHESLAPFGLRTAGPFGHSSAADWLSALASVADQPGHGPLFLVAADLTVSPVALLDLLDRPGDPTATVTVEAADVAGSETGPSRVRVQGEQRLVHSVGTSRHTVTDPTALAAGVLRLKGADRALAAQLWRAASGTASATDAAVAPFDLALLVLVRGGVRVGVAPLGPFRFSRGGLHSDGVAGSAWQQRLRGASRGGDGFFSTHVIRPLSRRLTGFGLAHSWSPNVVTITSLGLGLVGAGLAAVDNRWTWVAAAVLLQVAIVVDCVDGEVARFTRRFSALGAWLDAVGDRVKEYALLAAVAWVAVRRGEDAWWLATLAMVLVTTRHLEDYAHHRRSVQSVAHLVPDALPVDTVRDLGPDEARTHLPAPPSRREAAVFWTKKVLHMPIAERYLLLSLSLLTFNAQAVLWTLVVAVVVALVWTSGGRTVKAVLGRDRYRPGPDAASGHWGHLDHQLDLGPLARGAGRVARLPEVTAFLGCALVAGAGALAATDVGGWIVVGMALLGVLVTGAASRPPLVHRLSWQLPAALWVAEAALLVGVAWNLPEGRRWVVFAYLAAVAWHRYDVVYRLRDTGAPSRPWVTLGTLGTDGRLVALALLWALGGPVGSVLPWAALALFVVYAVESALGWRGWARGQRAAQPSSGEVRAA